MYEKEYKELFQISFDRVRTGFFEVYQGKPHRKHIGVLFRPCDGSVGWVFLPSTRFLLVSGSGVTRCDAIENVMKFQEKMQEVQS